MLKNTVKVLHKLNWLMSSDKQIAFTELSFQPFSGKFETIIFIQNPFYGMSESTFCLCRILYLFYYQICNPNRNYDLK